MPIEVNLHTEPFVTIKQAASKIGVHYWLLLKVVNSGAVPVYTLGNARKRVRLSEVVAYVEASRTGGSL
jgi:predicted site-specific integrase-resolvase